MFSRSVSVPNGTVMVKESYYSCDRCGNEFHEGDPHHVEGESHYCPECAYLLDKITTEEYSRAVCYISDILNVGKHNGVVYHWRGDRVPWERPDRDYRACQAYKEWRLAVFTRDAFTCQTCESTRPIEAHHIKTFNKHPDLRYEVSNGITLCRTCHIKEHRGRKNGTA